MVSTGFAAVSYMDVSDASDLELHRCLLPTSPKRRNSMFLQNSLRAQILALLGGSLLLTVVIALACFSFLSGGIQNYRGLLDGPGI